MTGDFEANLLIPSPWCWDISLACDYMFPAMNSNPYSLGILYSVANGPIDSIIFYSSNDGGMTLSHRQVLSIMSTTYPQVSLAYGRSNSFNTGRYFASWDEEATYTSGIGHLYTAHSDPDFNSAITKPVCLDSLDPSGINKFRNPKIASQFSSSDNDSSNFTEVIMFEKWLSPNLERGFYIEATTKNHFNEFSITSSSNNKIAQYMLQNTYTYQILCLPTTIFFRYKQPSVSLTNDVNLANPGTWNIISPAYNDSPNLLPHIPRFHWTWASYKEPMFGSRKEQEEMALQCLMLHTARTGVSEITGSFLG